MLDTLVVWTDAATRRLAGALTLALEHGTPDWVLLEAVRHDVPGFVLWAAGSEAHACADDRVRLSCRRDALEAGRFRLVVQRLGQSASPGISATVVPESGMNPNPFGIASDGAPNGTYDVAELTIEARPDRDPAS